MTFSIKGIMLARVPIFTISFFLALAFSPSAFGQCNSEGGDAQCVEEITSSNTFVKSYKIDGERNDDVEFSSVLVKDTRYYLNLCEEGELSSNVVINVYDAKRKLISSNKEDQTVLPELSFVCEKTGVYYFVFKKGSSPANCGIGALSFRR